MFHRGYAAYHPDVIAQGFNPAVVDPSLRNGTYNLIKAGFNVRGMIPKSSDQSSALCLTIYLVLFQGTEQPVSNIADRLKDKKYHVTVQGFGIRAYANGEATRRFEGNFRTIQNSIIF